VTTIPPKQDGNPDPDAARPTTLPRRPAGGDRRRTLDLKRLNTTPDGEGKCPPPPSQPAVRIVLAVLRRGLWNGWQCVRVGDCRLSRPLWTTRGLFFCLCLFVKIQCFLPGPT
jgi:hypothetical protein